MEAAFSDAGVLKLPPPAMAETMSVAEAMRRRRSHREFAARTLSWQQIGQLCWAAQGVTSRDGLRTAPSAGAIFPFTLMIADDSGVCEYRTETHTLQRRSDRDVRRELQAASLHQDCVGRAPVTMVLTADLTEMSAQYGSRAEMYALLEAGHIAQNILLQATALDLAGVPVGAFHDKAVARVLNLPQRSRPLYLIAVGHTISPND